MVSDIDIQRSKSWGHLAFCYAILGLIYEERSEQIRRMLLHRRKNSMGSVTHFSNQFEGCCYVQSQAITAS